MGRRLTGSQEVAGSTPATSTWVTKYNRTVKFCYLYWGIGETGITTDLHSVVRGSSPLSLH